MQQCLLVAVALDQKNLPDAIRPLITFSFRRNPFFDHAKRNADA
jgi:hypothetical protein